MDIADLQRSYCGFDLDAPVGNNAFSYERRSCRRLHVPALISGSWEDAVAGDGVAFCDIVDGREARATGLRHFVHVPRPGQDIFIFDNHNHAFSFWAAGFYAGALPPDATLVHVDQHKDTRDPPAWFTGRGPAEACHYANHVLNVGNFIPPAVRAGWFKEVVQVGSTRDFVEMRPRVLDIDLDIFAPVMDYIPEGLKLSHLRSWLAGASFVTIATSPFFMEQGRALHYLRELMAGE